MTDALRHFPRPVEAVPSALAAFDDVAARLAGRRPALFLDYDGTLTPIVAQPELAVLAEETRRALAAVAARLPVAVVTGRDRADVERRIGLDGLVYAGGYGFDIRLPGGAEGPHPGFAAVLTPVLDRVEAALRARLDAIPGAVVERKAFTVAAHFRHVAPAEFPRFRAAVDAAAAAPELAENPGKKVFEFGPRIDWNKGKAVLWLLHTLQLDRDGVVPVYVGDDLSDEDGFAALAGRGIGVVVAAPDDPEAAGRMTLAPFRVDNPAQVVALLRRLAG